MDRVNATLPPICFTAGNILIAFGLWGWLSLPFLALAGIGAVDTWFRWKEYVRLRDWFEEQERVNFGTFTHVMYRHKSSWCRRRLAVRAADTYGCGAARWARDYFQDQGYRWWHMLPDGFPAAFFTRSWWRGLVGRSM